MAEKGEEEELAPIDWSRVGPETQEPRCQACGKWIPAWEWDVCPNCGEEKPQGERSAMGSMVAQRAQEIRTGEGAPGPAKRVNWAFETGEKIQRAGQVVTSLVMGGIALVFIGYLLLGGKSGTPTGGAAHSASLKRCTFASTAQMAAIREGVKAVDRNSDVHSGFAVKSKDYQNVYFVAAKIYGPGMEQGAGPGVWAMGGTPENPGWVYSVGGYANQFSDWGDGGKTQAQLTLTSDGASEARECAR